MKNLTIRNVLNVAFYLPFYLSTITLAGPGGSGGADFARPVIWFKSYANAEIKACVAVSPDFGLTIEEAQRAAGHAAGIWGDYLAKIRENQGGYGSFGQAVTTNFLFSTKCDGSEALTVYFGLQNSEVNASTSGYREPLAFSRVFIPARDPNRIGSNKGFIYVASPEEVSAYSGRYQFSWAKNVDILESVLVHELGHVLGCGHVHGTIMDGDITQELFDERYIHPPIIDQQRQLLICGDACDLTYSATKKAAAGNAWAGKGFELLTGRKLQNLHSLTFDYSDRYGERMPRGALTYVDDSGSYKFPVKFIQITNLSRSGSYVFGQLSYSEHEGASYLGTLVKSNGEQAIVAVNRNNGSGIFDVRMMLEEEDFGQFLFYDRGAYKNKVFNEED